VKKIRGLSEKVGMSIAETSELFPKELPGFSEKDGNSTGWSAHLFR
jgi:hypothetical protein